MQAAAGVRGTAAKLARAALLEDPDDWDCMTLYLDCTAPLSQPDYLEEQLGQMDLDTDIPPTEVRSLITKGIPLEGLLDAPELTHPSTFRLDIAQEISEHG